MFIKRADYVTLIEKSARAEAENAFLLARVNQLELENGHLRAELSGKPQVVPTFKKDTPSRARDPLGGESFEDMGDDEAHKHGITWDDRGVVVQK